MNKTLYTVMVALSPDSLHQIFGSTDEATARAAYQAVCTALQYSEAAFDGVYLEATGVGTLAMAKR